MTDDLRTRIATAVWMRYRAEAFAQIGLDVTVPEHPIPNWAYGMADAVIAELGRYNPDAIVAATRAMCRELYGDNFDLHDEGSQDPDFRANLERAAQAAVEAYLNE